MSNAVRISTQKLIGKGYADYWNFKGRYRVCKGSRVSKKSKTTAVYYITKLMKHPEANLLVIRKTFRTLKDSCFAELKWAIHKLQVDDDWLIKESPLEMSLSQICRRDFCNIIMSNMSEATSA